MGNYMIVGLAKHADYTANNIVTISLAVAELAALCGQLGEVKKQGGVLSGGGGRHLNVKVSR